MAFREINMDALNIRDFRVGRFQNGKYYISLANTLADGYVICFSKTMNPITLDDLAGVPQDFLNRLLQNGYDEYQLPSGEWIALRAVPRRAFDAMPTFSDFTTHPPERIQVWTMLVRPHMDIYVPRQPGELSRPVRNIMLRGEAGTGKTEAAKAMAAALHLPYVSICCHPDMMITDFVGTILPKLRSTVTTGELPSFQDIEMDAAYAYSKLTGEEAPENITGDDVMRMIIERAVSENSDNNGLQYEYVDSDLVRAIKYGWLCEIQEPAIIERPGVLTGLNSLLDTCQQVTLPTGEVIKRHPDCVIVVTTNTGYQGCREINNSVISRMQYKKDTELPTDADLKERITGITGFDDDEKLTEMIKVIREIHTFCQERMITDGSCGVRELIDWVQSYMVLGSIVEAAECTIIPSASADVDNQQQIKIACLNPHFTD